jgi:EAL domain-containing protein (putative c-di-GMP-specific phosphodiesterase class I)/CheY-like chemotaxis protein
MVAIASHENVSSATARGAILPVPSKGKVLVVDDDLAVVRVYTRTLGAEGYHVFSATNGQLAAEMFRTVKPDAVVSDIGMPGMDGLSLLRTVRQLDRDVPVILATGDHYDERARRAVEEGALMYFVKPVDLRTLAQIVAHATQLHRFSQLPGGSRAGAAGEPLPRDDRKALSDRFDHALETLTVTYEPIVQWATTAIVGCTARVGSAEPLLRDRAALLTAAQQLGRAVEFGRTTRAAIAASMPRAPSTSRVFVNLHADELRDEALYTADDPLLRYSDSIVLEVTERDTLDQISHLMARIDRLRAAGFRIAIDNLGVGYAGLASFARLKPSFVKLDASLVRDIDRNSIKRKIVQAMTSLCREMSVEILAEGVETEDERQTLGFLGCHQHQGSAYACPQSPSAKILT